MRLAFVIDCMYNSGGMERVLSVCANALCDVYDITIITAFQKGQPDFFKLDSRIKRYDLGIYESANIKQKKREYKKALSSYLLVEHFDIAISLGGMDLDFLHSINDGSKKIIWFHFVFDIAMKAWLGAHPSVLDKIMGWLKTWRRVYYARKYDQIVTISKMDYEKWKRYTPNVCLIYNPNSFTPSATADYAAKTVISVGRLDYQKGFDYLIDAWKIVSNTHPDWHLNIYGDGDLKDALSRQIDELHLNKFISLCGRRENISEQYLLHSIYVMSSRTEAFGLVLVEAASCGLPLVAFDCPSGPSEIIEDGVNGFLIEKVGDIQGMANRICCLIENEELRELMGNNAKNMVSIFSIQEIREQWIKLIQ